MKIEIGSYWTDRYLDKSEHFMIVKILEKRKRDSNGRRRVIYECVYSNKQETWKGTTGEMIISHFRQAGRPATSAEVVLYVDKKL